MAKAAKAASKPKKDKRTGSSSRRDLKKADQQETNQRRAGYPSEDIGTPREASTMRSFPSQPDRLNKMRDSRDRGRKASSNLREASDRRKPKDRRK